MAFGWALERVLIALLVFRQARDASIPSRFPTFASIHVALMVESRLIGVEYAILLVSVVDCPEELGK